MFSGFRPAPIAATMAGSRPALSANGAWAYHSYCEPQTCAVMMIAISLRRLSSEVLNRMYSPTFCRRSASSGLRSQALNGPPIPFRGPDMMASATVRWAVDILSSEISAMRSPVKAAAEPANSRQMADARRIAFMVFLPVMLPGRTPGCVRKIVALRPILARPIRRLQKDDLAAEALEQGGLFVARPACYR